MIDLLKSIEFTPFLISFKLAAITTLILFFISLPLAWFLSQTKSRFKPVFEAITAESLGEMKSDILKAYKKRREENNQLEQATQAVQQYENQSFDKKNL
jgi:hypothetical protein